MTNVKQSDKIMCLQSGKRYWNIELGFGFDILTCSEVEIFLSYLIFCMTHTSKFQF